MGGIAPSSSDFFNSDSFRATNTSHDNRREEVADERSRGDNQHTKVVDLQNMQPFSNIQAHHQYFTSHGEEGKDHELEEDEEYNEDEGNFGMNGQMMEQHREVR